MFLCQIVGILMAAVAPVMFALYFAAKPEVRKKMINWLVGWWFVFWYLISIIKIYLINNILSHNVGWGV